MISSRGAGCCRRGAAKYLKTARWLNRGWAEAMHRRLLWNEDKSRPRSWAGPLLWPAALAYRGLLEGWWRWGVALKGGAKRLPVPVVSVGNIVVGGTGKTPATLWIATRLAGKGRKPAILARGYGGRAGRGPAVVSDGSRILSGPDEAGDEPVMLARRTPGVSVVVGSDRHLCGMYAVERFGADCAILDDGFQQLGLHRDLNLLLMDSSRPLGSGRLLPAGNLREPVAAVSRADLVVFTRWSQMEGGAADRARVEAVVGVDKIVTASHGFAGLVDAWHTDASHVSAPNVNASSVDAGRVDAGRGSAGGPVLLVSGIADPDSFGRTVREAGFEALDHLKFPDHHKYTARDVAAIGSRARAAGASMVLTTEKDAVRMPDEARKLDVPILCVRIELRIEKGLDILCEALESLFN